MSTNIAIAARKLRRWREQPAVFVNEELGVQKIDNWQLEVLKVFPSMKPEHMRIAMRACAGPGKSAVLAWCGWNFLSCYGDVGEHLQVHGGAGCL